MILFNFSCATNEAVLSDSNTPWLAQAIRLTHFWLALPRPIQRLLLKELQSGLGITIVQHARMDIQAQYLQATLCEGLYLVGQT